MFNSILSIWQSHHSLSLSFSSIAVVVKNIVSIHLSFLADELGIVKNFATLIHVLKDRIHTVHAKKNSRI